MSVWIGLIWHMVGSSEGLFSCEHGNEHSGTYIVKRGTFLDQLSTDDSAPRNDSLSSRSKRLLCKKLQYNNFECVCLRYLKMFNKDTLFDLLTLVTMLQGYKLIV
jgi:hypothetical protein